MTAATVWTPAEATPAPARRRHLTLVPELPAQTRSTMRLTRRGRLVRTLAVALAVVLLALAAVQAFAGGAPATTVTVEPGMTLSQVAATHMPQTPLHDAIVELRLANGLSSSELAVGQTLVVPK